MSAQAPNKMKTKKLACSIAAGSVAGLVMLTGCTMFTVSQRDEGKERVVTTTVRGTAWFSSAQTISKLKATTTEKTQSIGTDAIVTQGATNSVAALQSIVRILELLRPTP